jgi:hypothetical protein
VTLKEEREVSQTPPASTAASKFARGLAMEGACHSRHDKSRMESFGWSSMLRK